MLVVSYTDFSRPIRTERKAAHNAYGYFEDFSVIFNVIMLLVTIKCTLHVKCFVMSSSESIMRIIVLAYLWFSDVCR